VVQPLRVFQRAPNITQVDSRQVQPAFRRKRGDIEEILTDIYASD